MILKRFFGDENVEFIKKHTLATLLRQVEIDKAAYETSILRVDMKIAENSKLVSNYKK